MHTSTFEKLRAPPQKQAPEGFWSIGLGKF